MPRGGIETTIGHWSKLLEGLTASPLDFYGAVEAAVERREIPDCRLSRVDWREGGALSAKREYLRAERGEFLIDVCGAPFGNAFFASSWLCAPRPKIAKAIAAAVAALMLLGYAVQAERGMTTGLLAIAALVFLLGVVIFGFVRPLYFPPRLTYYRVDTGEMFYQAIHDSVLEVIDSLSTAQGVRLLSESERKPVMRGWGS